MFREAFRDELMCMMHFQILVLLSAEARLQREVSFVEATRSCCQKREITRHKSCWSSNEEIPLDLIVKGSC